MLNSETPVPKVHAISRRLLGQAIIGGSMATLYAAQNANAANNSQVRHAGSAQDLRDYIEIEQLLFRYCITVDNLDSEGFQSCFAPGGVLGVQGGDQYKGQFAEQIIDWHRKNCDYTMHIVLNHAHVVENEVANGMTYGIATLIMDEAGKLKKSEWYIRYHDKLVKRVDRWLFSERQLEDLFTVETPVKAFGARVRGGAPLIRPRAR